MDTPYAMVVEAVVLSTQDEARSHFETSPAPVLVVSERQTAGRGRTGAAWETAPRAVATSLALDLDWSPSNLLLIPLVAGLAAREAIAKSTSVIVGLKWPNDLVTQHGKLGGILVEVSGQTVVIGLGVNLWWPKVPAEFDALCPTDPGPQLAVDIARAWAEKVLRSVARPDGTWDRAGYLAACVTVGHEIEWEPDGTGTALDIAPDGGLVVATDSGDITLRSGTVQTIRTATLAGESEEQGQGQA